MLVTGLVVAAVCVVVQVVLGFLIRQKWRRGQERQEEIRRLLILAAEDDARAEHEYRALLDSATASVAAPVVSSYRCAACYGPASTRCARCKAVRYCSGKCQIVHWRQGHREECQPPPITYHTFDSGSNYGCKTTEKDGCLVSSERAEIEDRQLQEPIDTFTTGPVLSNSSCSPEISSRNDNDVEAEFLANGKRSNSTSESSSSFSGFSASFSGSESSDDVSVIESISAFDPEKSDGHISAGTALDIENTSGVDNLDRTKPLSPKFASLVDSVHSFTSSNKFNPTKHDSTSSSGPSTGVMHEGAIAETCASPSIFWERALNSGKSEDDSDVKSSLPISCEAGNDNKPNSISVLKFSFKLSESTISPSDAHVESLESTNVLPSTLGMRVPIDEISLSEKISTNAAKVKDSPSLNGLRSNMKEGSTGSFISKCSDTSILHPSSDTGCGSLTADTTRVKNMPSSSQRPNHAVNATNDKTSSSSGSSGSDVQPSSVGGYTVAGVKSKKVDGIHSNAAISLQGSSYVPSPKDDLKSSMLKVVDQLKVSKQKHYPFAVRSEIAGRYSDQGLFPYDIFVKLYNWNKIELLPCGLINCGNSCYANAVLQCLAFTPPLTAYFLQGLHSKTCANKGWCFCCEFESLILKAKDRNSPLSPTGILSQLQNIGSNLGHGREEDAHEFLRYAIDTMQSVCLKEAGAKSGSSEEETTLVGLTFGGYLRSKIKCMKCQGKSERQERMMDLTVEIEGDIGTLEEALRRFTGTEILDGENKYHCSRCKSYEKAKKKLTVSEAPNVLTIALKRFQSGKFGKLNKSIRFPEILNLAPYMSGRSDTSPIYRLCGVVVHLDIMNAAFSGHYVCYVKNIQNKWFKVDDSTVTAVEIERVLSKGAYMLLYSRCSPRAPRSVRNKIVTTDPKIRAIPSRNISKNATLKSKTSTTTDPRFVQIPSPVPSDGSPTYESFYSNFHRLQKILEVDSSSDNGSLISSNSDEGSYSTRDSSSTDDFSDYIFGDSSHGWNSPWRSSSDTDTSSSSSSPLYSRRSPLADSDQCGSTDHQTNARSEESKRSVPFLSPDTTKQCRNLGNISSSSSSCREID